MLVNTIPLMIVAGIMYLLNFDIKINLFPGVEIAKGSEALITKEKVLFAKYLVQINSSKRRECLSIGDTLIGRLDSIESDSEKVKKLIQSMVEFEKKDSLLKEMKRQANH